jgi:hypothetical protein
MGNILGETDSGADSGVKCFVTARDTRRTFQDEKVLILILMDVHRRAVTGAGDDLND